MRWEASSSQGKGRNLWFGSAYAASLPGKRHPALDPGRGGSEASHSDAKAHSVGGLVSVSVGLVFAIAFGLMGKGDAVLYTLSGLLGVTGAAQLAYILSLIHI